MRSRVSDPGIVFLGLVLAVALGFLTNALRSHPLPLRYENTERRLLSSVGASEGPGLAEPAPIEFRDVLRSLKDPGILRVDAREATLFEEGHIPGAINVPRSAFPDAAGWPALSDKSRPLIVYCSGEDCEDSRSVAKALVALGHSRVSVYTGGWEEWVASGSPVEK